VEAQKLVPLPSHQIQQRLRLVGEEDLDVGLAAAGPSRLGRADL
jgi:hypothetical protein